MTWFSSGFSNLKEQFNSLINDDDDNNEINSRSLAAESTPPSNAASKNTSLLKNLRQCDETNEEDEHLKRSQFPFTYRRDVVKYSKTLSDLLNDVNFLNASLDEVVGNVVRYIDENELLRHEVHILKDNSAEKETGALPPDTRARTGGSIILNVGAELNDKTECLSPPCREIDDCRGISTWNKGTQTAGSDGDYGDDREDYQWSKDAEITEFTEQIENLIIETDVISEKLNCIEKSWLKTTNDGDTCVAIRMDTLTDYTSLAHRRDILWEKLKVSFVWPTVAKFKNAKISELSVPDSIKEVFQPGFIPRSDDDDDSGEQMLQQQLAQSRAPVAGRNISERESISMTTQHQPPCPENNRDVITVTAQSSERSVNTEKSESATTSAAIVEVDRLRKHLISIEQAYTNELLQCEEEIQILRNELKSKEEKLNSVTESHTSMNLSTNRSIEQLQNEIKQLSDDKVQLTMLVSRCQNDLEKSLVDTRNLRSALDLFYKNKDCEIVQATEKLNSRIRMLQSDNECLRETVASLRKDLDASQHIFKKNEILSEELKVKHDEVNTLKIKVNELLQQRFENTDEGKHNFKMSTSTFDVEAKMRLNLIKNVAFRFITSDSPTTKSQSLRILADVLEFSDCEKMKIGIREQTYEKTKNNQSLIDEFIRFVEKESHPRTTQAETHHHQQQHQQEEEEQQQQQMRKKLSANSSSDFSPTNLIATRNTSINLPTGGPTSSSSILLKDALNSNDI